MGEMGCMLQPGVHIPSTLSRNRLEHLGEKTAGNRSCQLPPPDDKTDRVILHGEVVKEGPLELL